MIARADGARIRPMEIEYRCPTHGIVHVQPPIGDDEPPRTCPMTIRRRVDGQIEVSTCGLPLSATLG
jgi:hypothetical protein